MREPAQPLISVVVPAHNAEDTLAETVRSALAQSYDNLEIVVVDDGSTDGTAQVARRLCTDDTRVRTRSIAWSGPGAARNRGVAAAKGTYVAFLDADDLWHPDKLAKQMQRMVEVGPVGFVYCYSGRVDHAGSALPPLPAIRVQGWAFWRHLYWNFVGSGSALLTRKDALLAIGGFSEHAALHRCEDYLIQLRLAACLPVACTPEVLVYYRDRPGSISSDREAMFRAWRTAIATLRREGCLPRTRVVGWTYSRAAWGLAMTAIRQGSLRRAAGHLVTAVLGDPVRTAHNLARVVGRLLRGRPAAPDEQVIYALDERRLRDLADRDTGPLMSDMHPILAALATGEV